MKSLHIAMLDSDLFGRTFGAPTFAAWRPVAKAFDDLPLDATELELFRRITGRTEAPHSACREAYLIKPRRAGGTLFAADMGLHALSPSHDPQTNIESCPSYLSRALWLIVGTDHILPPLLYKLVWAPEARSIAAAMYPRSL